jgi:hypothetical protein
MFNQLNDVGKAKGNDNNIIKDFGDLKYYCEKCLNEAQQFYDTESKAFITFILSSCDLIQGISLQNCLDRLNESIKLFVSCKQLSADGLINYLKVKILAIDLSYSINLLNIQNCKKNENNNNNNNNNNKITSDSVNKTVQELIELEKTILHHLRIFGGEAIECQKNKATAYFDSVVADIKNLFNSLFHYLCHTKLRLGSCLILLGSLEENPTDATSATTMDSKLSNSKYFLHALNVLCNTIELNKVISERSVYLELELNYKYAYCVRELFVKYQLVSLNDVCDAYVNTIHLAQSSTHDLNLIRNCYAELAVALVSLFDSTVTALHENHRFAIHFFFK